MKERCRPQKLVLELQGYLLLDASSSMSIRSPKSPTRDTSPTRIHEWTNVVYLLNNIDHLVFRFH